MAILLVEIPIASASVDEQRFPERDHLHILEHLLHYCAKFDPILPAATSGRAVDAHRVATCQRQAPRGGLTRFRSP